MKLLITAATSEELFALQQVVPAYPGVEYIFAVTGIGITATAYHTLKNWQTDDYSLVINTGIAGSFTSRLPVGSVCYVTKEYFGDCGIQTPQGFLTLFDEKLLNDNTFPFAGGALHAPVMRSVKIAGTIPAAVGVTVHTASGEAQRIAELVSRFSPDIETMESAAFFYVCLQEKIPFLALRAVSNMVEPRDKLKWNIPLALQNLGATLRLLLQDCRTLKETLSV